MLELKEIHDITLDVVVKIQSICQALGLRYYVMYGSLIGAVRHKGFIPWDDDFDIVMMRPDYDQFLQYCYDHIEELTPYRLINRNTNKDYPFNISRFCDCRYHMIRNDEQENAGMGIFIDIYPFDGLGGNLYEINSSILIKKYILLAAQSLATGKLYSKQGWLRTVCKFPLWLIARLIGRRRILREFIKFRSSHSFDDSKYVGCLVWDYWFSCFEKEWFSETVLLDFENIQVAVPYKYHEILSAIYGNYMDLPPVDLQIPTHMYKIVEK